MPRLRLLALVALLLPMLLAPVGGAAPILAERLQQAVEQSMAGRSGTVVVLDVASGRVLAQHNLDVAARRLAPPGSALKPFTLLALLERGTLKPETTLVCRRRLRLAGHRLDCTHPPTSEPLDAVAALAYSCNYYFAHFAARLGADDLRQAFGRAGLTTRTGLAPEEATGSVAAVAQTELLQLQALGHAGIEVTPLELLAAYRRLALRRKDNQPISPALATVLAGLEASTDYGMGRSAQPPGLRVAGKTGTAAAKGGAWTHAWFAGYAPADNPEIVLVVFLERGRGGVDATEVARCVFEAYAAAKDSR